MSRVSILFHPIVPEDAVGPWVSVRVSWAPCCPQSVPQIPWPLYLGLSHILSLKTTTPSIVTYKNLPHPLKMVFFSVSCPQHR